MLSISGLLLMASVIGNSKWLVDITCSRKRFDCAEIDQEKIK
jgi:hypothetical protein